MAGKWYGVGWVSGIPIQSHPLSLMPGRELIQAAPKYPWEAWSFPKGGKHSHSLASRHRFPFNWDSASGFTWESQSSWSVWGWAGSWPYTGTGNLTRLPNAPKLLFYTFSKCQQNSSVIYADQQTEFSPSFIIFTLSITRSCLGRCPWQKLIHRWVLQMFHIWKPLAKEKEKAH